MPDREKCQVGQWVQVYQVVLPAGKRAPGLPEDTAQVPLEMWVKGFAQSAVSLGDQVTIITQAGREVSGKLVAIEPTYSHGFGQPVPELLEVAQSLRQRYRRPREAAEHD